MTRDQLASLIDHTLLRPDATTDDVRRHCREALEHRFRGVCLFPSQIGAASEILSGSDVILSAVVSFPSGGATLLSKVFEALEAWKLGAEELDVVVNLSAIASGNREVVEEEVRTIMQRTPECRHKFIVEAGLWSVGQLDPVLSVMNQRRPAFVKTSTGVNARGAEPGDVAMLRAALHRSIGIKASGGVRTLQQAIDLVGAGATCIGTSAGVELVRQLPPVR